MDAPPPPGPLARLLRALRGPPVVLPPILDRAAEGWAAAGPRLRFLVGVLAVAAIIATSSLGALRSPWGSPASTVVAVRDLPAGVAVHPGDVEARSWPTGLRPPGALTDPREAVGRQLAASVPAGTPLVPSHLADHGPAAELPAGYVAFPLPIPDGVVVRPGQYLDVLAGDGQHGGRRLADGARVLAVDGAVAWIAVRRDQAPDIAAAASWGQVVVALLPPPR